MAEELPDVLLETAVRDQDDLERDIGRQADQMLTEQADERDKKRQEKTNLAKTRLNARLRQLQARLSHPANSSIKNKIRSDIADIEVRLRGVEEELGQIQQRIDERHQKPEDRLGEAEANGPLPNETRRDFLIRTGKITPFSKIAQVPRVSKNLSDVMFDAEAGDDDGVPEDSEALLASVSAPKSHQNLRRPGFRDEEAEATDEPEDDYTPGDGTDGDGAEEEEDGEDDEEFHQDFSDRPQKRKGKRVQRIDEVEDLSGVDDGNERVYQRRLQKWSKERRVARLKAQRTQLAAGEDQDAEQVEGDGQDGVDLADECFQPHPTIPDAEFDNGFKIPGDIFPSLFDYQKTGVQWLSELYNQQVGGIIGDEMGLGKTIQVISFLAGLHHSRKVTKPIIIVAPATVMKQWVNEFHQWWPPLRVSILHTSGSGMINVRRESALERAMEDEVYSGSSEKLSDSQRAAKKIVDRVCRDGHVLVTTYTGLLTYAPLLIPIEWEYAVLDEGHKIRNPETGVAYHCKTLQTHNRIILSGTPMQNNLTELWSLFDFVFPMRLGTLPSFRLQFEHPIKQGGYANASNLQVETAMKCAETLKEAISPYLLQRFKVDVAQDLPKKSERVLFCKLTKLQREAYEWFLRSDDMKSILAGKRQALYGVDILRKISNHPDLVEHKTLPKKAGYDYGSGNKSGKMQVVKALLEMWKKNGHKTLLFSQQRITLDILEKFVTKMDGVKYLRMDGTTDIKDRQRMVDQFNNDPNLHVFLLTTKVGGLGVNLTGADRVIIFDPDWNPSTDVQARERAWRLGQKREVEIYRLMTAGTIEEKIYHRQIFKQFLTNKILRDPKQRQTFQLRDLTDLFTLGEEQPEGQTETGNIFKGTEVHFKEKASNITTNAGIPTPPTESELASHTSPPKEDLKEVFGISRSEEFKAPNDEPSTTSTNDDPKDSRLLSTIFSRSGVTSALEHDAILESGNSSGRKRKVQADPEMIAREAKRIASEAASELRKAGEAARNVPIGTPTWTGSIGEAGRPQPTPFRGGGRGGRGGLASSSILSNLSIRNTGNLSSSSAPLGRGRGSASSSRASTPSATNNTPPTAQQFIVLIRDYLQAHGGSVYTQMLIDHFNRYCTTERATAEFKEMLREIASLERGSRGRGRWVLKAEYRGTGRGGAGGLRGR